MTERRRLTIREVESVACDLGRFTRTQLAERLELAPLEVGKWLARMTDREKLSRDGREYTWSPADERPAPPPPTHAGMDCRVVAHRLGSFTTAQFAEAMGLSTSYASQKIMWLLDNDTIRDSGKTEYRERGKQPTIYEVVPIKVEKVERVKHEPPEKTVQPEIRRHEAQLGTNWRKVIKHEETRELAEAVEQIGGEVHVSKHIIFRVNGSKVVTGKTPGKPGVKVLARVV